MMSASTLSRRSAWVLRHPRGDELPWWRRAACKNTPHLHGATATIGRANITGPHAQARHICIWHCPVIRECHAEAMRVQPVDVVHGGLIWASSRHGYRGQPAKYQPDAGHGPWCQHLNKEATA